MSTSPGSFVVQYGLLIFIAVVVDGADEVADIGFGVLQYGLLAEEVASGIGVSL